MASNNTYDINKTRYTHRDYESVKSDLIEIIPSLTQEWTSREESDPGIVLVKLMSMVCDNLSFNMDKMALEMYLSTVTQRKNCAKILQMLGYKMHWYRSAVVNAFIKTNVQGEYAVLVPFETVFRPTVGDINYTFIPQTDDDFTSTVVVSSDTVPVQVKLVEGIYNSSAFTDADLVDNRFYINANNVDENHLYLTYGSNQIAKLVEDLTDVTDEERLYYEFNVDEYNKPYIELSDRWRFVYNTTATYTFNLRYILSSGEKGNITSNTLTAAIGLGHTPENGLSIFHYGSISDSVADSVISNNSQGKDPETVAEARKEAYKYVHTYDTLVTASDFEKACLRADTIDASKLVDNQIIIYEAGEDADRVTELTNEIVRRELPVITKEVTIVMGNNTYTRIVELTVDVVEEFDSQTYAYLKGYFTDHAQDFENYTFTYDDIRYTILVVINEGETAPYIIDVEDVPDYITYNNVKDKLEDIPNPSDYTITYDDTDCIINVVKVNPEASDEIDVNIPDYANQELPPYLVYMYLSSNNFNLLTNQHYSENPSPTLVTDGISADNVFYSTYNYTNLSDNANVRKLGYYPYKPPYAAIVKTNDIISHSKIMNVEVEYTTTKLFPFTVNGMLYLTEPLTPDEIIQIVNSIEESLQLYYSADNQSYGSKVQFMNVIDQINNSNPQIKYFDADSHCIEYNIMCDMDKFDMTSFVKYVGLGQNFNLAPDFRKFKITNNFSSSREINFGAINITSHSLPYVDPSDPTNHTISVPGLDSVVVSVATYDDIKALKTLVDSIVENNSKVFTFSAYR